MSSRNLAWVSPCLQFILIIWIVLCIRILSPGCICPLSHGVFWTHSVRLIHFWWAWLISDLKSAGSYTLVNFKPTLHTFFKANLSQGNVFDKIYGYEITPPLDLSTLVEKTEYRITYDDNTGKACVKQVWLPVVNSPSGNNPVSFM